jgi:hypothetical protein
MTRTRSNRRQRRSAVTTTSASLTPIGEVGDLFEDAGAVALQLRGASLEPLGCGGRDRDACPEARERPGRCEADPSALPQPVTSAVSPRLIASRAEARRLPIRAFGRGSGRRASPASLLP